MKHLLPAVVLVLLLAPSLLRAQFRRRGHPVPDHRREWVVSTLAGTGRAGYADGAGRGVSFSCPMGVAVDAAGTVYVADTENHCIRRITAAGVVSTLAGQAGQAGSTDGPGPAARFNYPTSLARAANGTLYVADSRNRTIRRIGPDGVVSTLAGKAGEIGTADGPGAAARFNDMMGLAVDSRGTLYVADTYNHAVRKITPAGLVSTLAGVPDTSRQAIGHAEGRGADARFGLPEGVAVSAAGIVYVTDPINHVVYRISPEGDVRTLAGAPGEFGWVDGVGDQARLLSAEGIALAPGGQLFITEEGADLIKQVSPTGKVTTLAGTRGQDGRTDGRGQRARFHWPYGIAVGPHGTLYVADALNHSIRVLRRADQRRAGQ